MSTPPAAVDLGALDTLVREIGDASTVQGIVLSFLEELPGRVESIDRAYREGDREAARRPAHSLKSTSLLLGARSLSALAATLEAGTGDPAALADEARRTAPVMRRWLARSHLAALGDGGPDGSQILSRA